MNEFLDAVESDWKPTPDVLGAAGREVLGCMSWSGKKSALALVQDIHSNLDPQLKYDESKYRE